MRLLPVLIASASLAPLFAQTPDPFAATASAHVLVFVRTDCPITNRYAPELHRIGAEFASKGVNFWMVYADRSETPAAIAAHMREYALPGTPVRDPSGVLAKRAQATIAPEAAVFDRAGTLRYVGRIDDRYVSIGKMRPAPSTHDLEAALRAVLAGQPVLSPRTKAIGCYLADLR